MESNKITDSRKEKTNSEEDWDSSDYVNIEEEDSEEEDESWDEEDEDWEKEMGKMNKVE